MSFANFQLFAPENLSREKRPFHFVVQILRRRRQFSAPVTCTFTHVRPKKNLISFNSLPWSLVVVSLYFCAMRLSWTCRLFARKVLFYIFVVVVVLVGFFHQSAIHPYLIGYLPEVSPSPAANFYVRNQSQFVFVHMYSRRPHFFISTSKPLADLVHVSLRKVASFSTPQLHLKYLRIAKGIMISRHIVFCHNIYPRTLLLLFFCLQELFYS